MMTFLNLISETNISTINLIIAQYPGFPGIFVYKNVNVEKKKKLPDIEITELFLIKADWERTFIGEIIREKTNDDTEIYLETVVVTEGKIWSAAETQEELVKNLVEISKMKLDMELHLNPGVSIKIFGADFFLN